MWLESNGANTGLILDQREWYEMGEVRIYETNLTNFYSHFLEFLNFQIFYFKLHTLLLMLAFEQMRVSMAVWKTQTICFHNTFQNITLPLCQIYMFGFMFRFCVAKVNNMTNKSTPPFLKWKYSLFLLSFLGLFFVVFFIWWSDSHCSN